jgi:MFS family permease
MVSGLGVTACVSYGVLAYSFAVFLAPMEAELGWTRAQLTGAFSAAWLVAGLSAIPLGRWVDRQGARVTMTAGSVLAASLLVAWSQVTNLAAFYAIWMAMGVACAAVLYEPAFAVVATWFERRRSHALTLLTFLGGLASIVFVPLSSWLVAVRGWREALAWLAALLAAITIPVHALLLRRRPQDHGLSPDGQAARSGMVRAKAPRPAVAAGVTWREAIRGSSFRYLTIGFGLAQLASTAMTVHLVPLLLERGYGPLGAGGIMGTVGLMALPGRLVFTPLGSRWPRGLVTAAIFALQALGVGVLLATRSELGVWLFVALFGAGFGAITPARAALVADIYGSASYASISGAMSLVLALAAAAAPFGASLLHDLGGSYRPMLAIVLAASIVSGWLAMAADRVGSVRPRELENAA